MSILTIKSMSRLNLALLSLHPPKSIQKTHDLVVDLLRLVSVVFLGLVLARLGLVVRLVSVVATDVGVVTGVAPDLGVDDFAGFVHGHVCWEGVLHRGLVIGLGLGLA